MAARNHDRLLRIDLLDRPAKNARSGHLLSGRGGLMAKYNDPNEMRFDCCYCGGYLFGPDIFGFGIENLDRTPSVVYVTCNQPAPQRRLDCTKISAEVLVNQLTSTWIDQQQIHYGGRLYNRGNGSFLCFPPLERFPSP